MTPDADDDLQTRMLASFQKSEVQVFIFLVNGIKLTGRIASFDKYTIGLESPTGIQTVYKRAVSTSVKLTSCSAGRATFDPET
jgi:host factor-I protein